MATAWVTCLGLMSLHTLCMVASSMVQHEEAAILTASDNLNIWNIWSLSHVTEDQSRTKRAPRPRRPPRRRPPKDRPSKDRPPVICLETEFKCDNGICTQYSNRCDGNVHCADSSDETNCHNSKCPNAYFRCASGQCISFEHRCDETSECTDSSDEIDCHNSTCGSMFWRCNNAQCVNKLTRCDAGSTPFVGCNDNSDENNCQDFECGANSFKCNSGHCVSMEARCDNGSSAHKGCPDGSDENDCLNSTCPDTMFRCDSGQYLFQYKVCDEAAHCPDGMDEINCHNRTCSPGNFRCESGQCIDGFHGRCDGKKYGNLDCRDGSDELLCLLSKCPKDYYRCRTGQCMQYNPCNTNLTTGEESCDVRTDPVNHCQNHPCPPDYTRCTNGRCLHYIYRCDGVNDCEDQEETDELNCGTPDCREDQLDCGGGECIPKYLVCDGYRHSKSGFDESECWYNGTAECPKRQRCSQSSRCVEPDEVCDMISQCPNSDDERLCFTECPRGCVCVNGLIDCTNKKRTDANSTEHYPLWPFEDLETSPISPKSLLLERTHSLILTRTKLKEVPIKIFLYMPYLQILRLNQNEITKLVSSSFRGLYRLSVLDLSRNKIGTIEDFAFKGLRIGNLDLKAKKLDQFGNKLFAGMAADGTIRTSDNIFCCIRPKHLLEKNCFPGWDQFSSCDDLLENIPLRVLLWTVGALALVGNVLTLILRMIYERKSLKIGFGIFVTNLSIADFLMGVYLITIAIVDETFRGRFVTESKAWRKSTLCTFAGIVSIVSTEASVFFICLITVERLIAMTYPFGEYRIRKKLACVLSALVWILSILLGMMPLFVKRYFKGRFFSTSGVCVALPLTPGPRIGWEYSVAVFLGVNCILFVVICIGQFLIYYKIVSSRRKCATSAMHTDEIKIARRLMLVVLTDFVCWVPIGCLSIMARLGVETSPVLYAWVVVFVLPVNSALNPFLYTIMAIRCSARGGSIRSRSTVRERILQSRKSNAQEKFRHTSTGSTASSDI